jgi:hydrogenase nickel incorporation protein HypB
MFNKADVVLINKIDTANASDLVELASNVRQVNPRADIFALSARTGEGLTAWTKWLQRAIDVRVPAALASI